LAYIFLTAASFLRCATVLYLFCATEGSGVRYLFEDYALDTDVRELRRGAKVLAVAPQVFDLLQYLLVHREHVVSKEELIHAIWNGRAVSDAALATRLNVARAIIGDTGDQQRLIKTLPRKGFRFAGEVKATERPRGTFGGGMEAQLTTAAISGRPTIAILPFVNLSSDPEQEHIADGIAEDLTTALSRFPWLIVIARSSRLKNNDRSFDIKKIGLDLGVRYLLQGSVRKTGSRMRIAGQLIDTETGAYIWADQFDGPREDVFEFQDRVTSEVINAIAPRLERQEFERAKRKPPGKLNGYDHYLRGTSRLRRISQDATDEALGLFLKAVELDPGLACAYGMAAWCHVLRKVRGWAKDSEREINEATRFARKATLLGADDPTALSTGGYALAFTTREFEDAARFMDRALAIDPNLVRGWKLSAWLRVWTGEPDLVLEHIAHAVRLNPLHPHGFPTSGASAYAHFLANRYDMATACAERAFRDNPTYMVASVSTASHALAGRPEQARMAMARALECNPNLCTSKLNDFFPFSRLEDAAKFAGALHLAGLPG
jgi:TolB-like protein